MRVVVLLAATGCGFNIPAAGGVPSTTDASDSPGSQPADAPGPWSTPTPIVLDVLGVDDPSLTADRLELYFNANSDIYVTKRAATTAAWGPSSIVTQASGPSSETTPEISRDGLTLTFASDRAGTQGGTDIWITTRPNRSATWGTAIVVPELSTPLAEAGAVMTPDGRRIVFTSYRKANISPDIYLSERPSGTGVWGPMMEVTALNTDLHEGSAFLTDDALVLCFDTDRTGNLDLYCSERSSTSDVFPAPQPLADIDTTFSEEDPWLSPDGRQIVFYSNRGGFSGLWEASR